MYHKELENLITPIAYLDFGLFKPEQEITVGGDIINMFEMPHLELTQPKCIFYPMFILTIDDGTDTMDVEVVHEVLKISGVSPSVGEVFTATGYLRCYHDSGKHKLTAFKLNKIELGGEL